MQVSAFTFEELVLFDMKNYVEIACGASECAGFAVACKANTSTVFDSGGNFCIDGALTEDAAIAFALRAGIGNDGACSLAGRAGTRDREEALLVTNLAFALAGAAGDWCFAGRRACAVAGFAGFVTADSDLGVRTENCLLEFESQVFAKIGATLRARTAGAAAASGKHVAEAEELAKDLAEILEGIRIEAAAGASGADSGVAKAVVGGTLVGIGENGVGLSALLELFFRVRVVRVTVGMVRERELAVGALDLHFGRGAGDAENLVVVAFSVTGQNGLPLPWPQAFTNAGPGPRRSPFELSASGC